MGLLREDEMKKRLQERKGGERQRTVTGERNRMMFFSVPEELGVNSKRTSLCCWKERRKS